MNDFETPNNKQVKKPFPWWLLVGAILLLGTHAFLVHRNIMRLSPVVTEIGHLVRGSEALLGDTKGLGRHPHPYDYVVGLQLMASPEGHRPTSTDKQAPIGDQLDKVVMQWVHTGLFDSSHSPLIAARHTTLLLSLLLGLVVMAASRSRWGDIGGLLSLAMYCLSPTILAHASLATPDLANAAILTVLALWTWRSGIRLSKGKLPPRVWLVMLLVLVGLMQWAMATKPLPTAMWSGSWYLNGQTYVTHPSHYYLYTFLIKTPLAMFVLWMLATGAWINHRSRMLHELQQCWPMLCIIMSTLFVASRITLPMGHRLLMPMYPALFILAGAAVTWPKRRVKLHLADGPSTPNNSTPVQGLVALMVGLLGAYALLFGGDFLTYTNQAARHHNAIFPHLAGDNGDWGQTYRQAATHADYLAGYGPLADADPMTASTSLLQWQDAPLHGGRFVISSNYLAGAVPDVLPKAWTVPMETEFQRLRDYFQAGLLRLPEVEGHHHDDAMPTLSHEQWMWLRLRLARICAHLRIREPDAVIGRTMLMYQLSDEQVQYMMDTPPYGDEQIAQ